MDPQRLAQGHREPVCVAWGGERNVGFLHPSPKATVTCLPLVGQFSPSGNFFCNQSPGLLKVFNPKDVFQEVSLQQLGLRLVTQAAWQM